MRIFFDKETGSGSAGRGGSKSGFQRGQKYTNTANIVPVCSMMSRNVSRGADGSRPISFSATMTWAELETGSSSAAPWMTARTRTLT